MQNKVQMWKSAEWMNPQGEEPTDEHSKTSGKKINANTHRLPVYLKSDPLVGHFSCPTAG